MPAKVKKGDEYMLRATVTRVSDDGETVTLKVPVYGMPITLPARALDTESKVPG